jgi:hypothetical protein
VCALAYPHREITNWTGFFCRKRFGGPGGTRNDFVAENGFEIPRVRITEVSNLRVTRR